MANIPLSLRSCCQNSDTIYHFFPSPSTTYNSSFAFPPLLQLLPNIHSCDFLISSSCCHFLIMSFFFSFAPISEPACPSSIRIIILSQVPLLILLFLLFSIFPQSILHPLDISSFLHFLILILLFLSFSLFFHFILLLPQDISSLTFWFYCSSYSLFPRFILLHSLDISSFPPFDFTFPLILSLPPHYYLHPLDISSFLPLILLSPFILLSPLYYHLTPGNFCICSYRYASPLHLFLLMSLLPSRVPNHYHIFQASSPLPCVSYFLLFRLLYISVCCFKSLFHFSIVCCMYCLCFTFSDRSSFCPRNICAFHLLICTLYNHEICQVLHVICLPWSC